MELLQVEDLSFRYPEAERETLRSVSFSLNEGEFAVLIGASGSGKTTLLKLIKRELAPCGEQRGAVLFDGRPIGELDEKEAVSGIGFILQNPENQIVTDKVWHELAFGLESLGLPNGTIRRRVAEMAGYFGIEGWFRKNTAELSGGEKQLLNLSSVMVMQPRLLLLDEPTAELDPIAASNFIHMLKRLNRETGLTVLLIEQRLEEAVPAADRILFMDGGRLAYDGTPGEIASYFAAHPDDPMREAMPSAMRIAFDAGGEEKQCPVTVREGREWIRNRFLNRIRSLGGKETKEAAFKPDPEIQLNLSDIWFRYGKTEPDVLRGVQLSVEKGEHLVILGGNGAGKTTLLGVMTGILKPYRGEVSLFGKKIGSIGQKSLYRNGIALLPQNPEEMFLKKTLREDLDEIVQAMEYDRKEADALILEFAKELGIEALLSRHPYDLSGGETERAALLKLLLLKPRILVMDEPTKGMDAPFKRRFGAILRRLNESGISVITVTHDVEFAAEFADRCAMLFDGEVLSVGTPDVFFSENQFYTTAANRIAKGIYDGAVLVKDVVGLIKENGRKDRTNEEADGEN